MSVSERVEEYLRLLEVIRVANRDENLELFTRSDHAKEHDAERGRDELGRFPPADLRVREMPEAPCR